MNIFDTNIEKNKYVTGSAILRERPTGDYESIPFIAKRNDEGPVLTLSANLHGNEYTGTRVIQELLQEKQLLEEMNGTLVCLPTLNPLGALLQKRTYSFTNQDPNRAFTKKKETPSTYTEKCMETIYREIEKISDLHIDLHCSKIKSIPFTYSMKNPPLTKEKKETYKKALKAFNLLTVSDSKKTREEKNKSGTLTSTLMHRSNIPAFTAELGPKEIVEEKHVELGLSSLKRVMNTLEMADTGTKKTHNHPAYKNRNLILHYHPRCPQPGHIQFLKQPGETVEKGERVAILRNHFGEVYENGNIISDKNGYVICHHRGTYFGKDEPIMRIASPK